MTLAMTQQRPRTPNVAMASPRTSSSAIDGVGVVALVDQLPVNVLALVLDGALHRRGGTLDQLRTFGRSRRPTQLPERVVDEGLGELVDLGIDAAHDAFSASISTALFGEMSMVIFRVAWKVRVSPVFRSLTVTGSRTVATQ
jgi:hypothetical protein